MRNTIKYLHLYVGKKVGVLQGRLHDIAVVAQHGGILKPGSIRHTMWGIDELLTMLQDNTISGFLIDRNTYYHFSHRGNTTILYKSYYQS